MQFAIIMKIDVSFNGKSGFIIVFKFKSLYHFISKDAVICLNIGILFGVAESLIKEIGSKGITLYPFFHDSL